MLSCLTCGVQGAVAEQGDDDASQQGPRDRIRSLSVFSEGNLRSKLGEARRQGRTLRLRVTMPTVAAGSFLIVAGLVLQSIPALHDNFALGNVPVVTGFFVLMLALMPNEERAVRISASAISCALVVAAALNVRHAIHYMTHHKDALDLALRPDFECVDSASHAHAHDGAPPCWFTGASIFFLLGITAVEAGAAARIVYMLWWGQTPRAIVDAMWRLIGTAYLVAAMLNLFIASCTEVAGIEHVAGRAESGGGVVRYWVNMGALVLALTVYGMVARSPGFRRYAQASLAAHGEAVTSAAAISALLGRGSVDGVLQTARESFRYVTIGDMRFEEMSESKPNPAAYLASRKASLNEVDAFVSHSWRDDPRGKWAALVDFCDEFEHVHGRPARLWVDKYCVDQSDIETNVRMLPIFLASCDRLLVLYGPTYVQRLWCIAELWVFLQMNGLPTNVEVRTVSSDDAPAEAGVGPGGPAVSAAAAQEHASLFALFDVHSCECFKAQERERLLAMIEAGFGRLERFNMAVRELLAASLLKEQRRRRQSQLEVSKPTRTEQKPHSFRRPRRNSSPGRTKPAARRQKTASEMQVTVAASQSHEAETSRGIRRSSSSKATGRAAPASAAAAGGAGATNTRNSDGAGINLPAKPAMMAMV